MAGWGAQCNVVIRGSFLNSERLGEFGGGGGHPSPLRPLRMWSTVNWSFTRTKRTHTHHKIKISTTDTVSSTRPLNVDTTAHVQLNTHTQTHTGLKGSFIGGLKPNALIQIHSEALLLKYPSRLHIATLVLMVYRTSLGLVQPTSCHR